MSYGKTLVQSTWWKEETDSIGSQRLSHYDLRTVPLNVIQKQRKYVRKIDFTIKIESEAEGLSRPKSIGILTVLRCISCPDLVILAYTGDKLSCGQAQNEVKLDFHVKFYLEVQGRSSPQIIGILTKVFCTYVSNLVILAWTADKLSCGQASDWYTQTHTHWQIHRQGQWQHPKAKTGLG